MSGSVFSCVHVAVYMCMCVCDSVAVIVGSRSVSCCVVARGCGSHEGWREGWGVGGVKEEVGWEEGRGGGGGKGGVGGG